MKNKVVTRSEWLKSRIALLRKERELNTLRDALSKQRRKMPWVKVGKDYVFDGPAGKVSLADLFDGRRQLIVYHFMFGPEAKDGCPGCSLVADNFNGSIPHLNANEVTFVAASRGPFKKLAAFKKRMGWSFPWVSSGKNDFNYDFWASFKPEQVKNGKVYQNFKWRSAAEADETPGASVFFKDDAGDIYHTYSTFSRGLDMLLATYHYFDLMPLGRNESSPMSWLRLHDKYD